MGLFDKFRQPPQQFSQQEIDAMMYEDQMAMQSPLSSGVPPPSMYGQPSASFNEKMMELAIGTHITIGGKEIINFEELPTLFYFLTDNWRHFELSNLKGKDQRRLEVRLKHIHRMSGQGGMEYLCKIKQLELLNTVYFHKSRSDMNRMTEREILTLQSYASHNDEIKRPKESNSGFFSSIFGMGRRD